MKPTEAEVSTNEANQLIHTNKIIRTVKTTIVGLHNIYYT